MYKPFLFFVLFINSFVVRAQVPQLVEDIYPGTGGSFPQGLTFFHDTLYFGAVDTNYGKELWAYYGQGIPSKRISDSYPGKSSGWAAESNVPMSIYKNKIYYGGYSGINAHTLLSYSNPVGLKVEYTTPYVSGGLSAVPFNNFDTLNNLLYFVGDSVGYTSYLCSYDGLTVPIVHNKLNSSVISNLSPSLVRYKGKIFFCLFLSTSGYGNELYAYNPATNQVNLEADIAPGTTNGNPSGFKVYGSKLYFVATDTSHGMELWSYDGTTATRLTDIVAGKGDGVDAIGGRNIEGYNGSIYFPGIVGVNHKALYRYDTLSHASSLAYDPQGSDPVGGVPQQLYATPSNLYFYFSTTASGSELYKYNSFTGGSMVADLFPGVVGGAIGTSNIILNHGYIYFLGKNSTSGGELFQLQDVGKSNVGVQNAGWDGAFEFYPNPVHTTAGMNLTLKSPQFLFLTITDLLGKRVFSTANSYPAGASKISIPFENYAPGQYFYHLNNTDGKALGSGVFVKE